MGVDNNMIHLNTISYEKDILKYENNHSKLFSVTVMNEELDEKDIEIIKYIDNAEYIGNNTMRDRFGNITSIKNLSTGAKIVLNTKWLIEHGKDTPINITSCGDNALEALVDIIKEKDIYMLTCNYVSLCDAEVSILVNDKYKIDSFSELDTLGEALYETGN